jgi:DNA invertase Pin-like site-specific DNA recombinase
LAYVAEKERLKLRSRQAQGIALAQEKGVYKGRKPITIDADKFAGVYKQWRIDKTITAKKAMELLGVKKDIFYTYVKTFEGKNTAGS